MKSHLHKTKQAIQSALDHLNAGQLQQAGRICQDILTGEPDNAAANHLFGVINCQAGRIDAGIPFIRKAIHSKPDYVEAHKNLGKALKISGYPEAAADSYRKVISLAPDYAEVHNDLGNTYYELGSFAQAIAAYRQAIAIVPNQAGFYNNLGIVLKKTGNYDEAISCCQKALSFAPDYVEAYSNLGNIYGDQGDLDRAETCYRQAVAMQPDYAEAHNNLGNMLLEQGRPAEALPCYRKALAIKPAYAEAYSNLGKALIFKGALSEAAASCRQAISLQPGFVEAYYNLGNALKEQGFLEEALANYRQALSLKRDFTIARSSILFTLNYLDDHPQEEIYQEALQWGQQFAKPLLPAKLFYQNTREENRRLRIGYVSQDLRNHSVAYFFEPTLQAHDRKDVEVFCYANVKKPDEVTARLQAASDHWRSIVGLRNEDVAERIREDRIDILVDLAGHTAENRLEVFAYKPAPIQVSWLGYPNTTGIRAIDYRFTDSIADPPGETDRFYTEELIRLKNGFLSYQAEQSAPEVSEPPCMKNGYITFGSFNNLAKMRDGVIDCWSTILQALPGARLILKSKPLADNETKERCLKKFMERGIPAERLEFYGWLPDREGHLGLYKEVDIGLDPFPYSGTTTTCEAMWMGVPVVTLRGERHAGRVGASIMHQIDLEEMVADSVDGYIELAKSLASDPDLLLEMRRGLRMQMQDSMLMDSRLFVKGLEEEYRRMWQIWCTKKLNITGTKSVDKTDIIVFTLHKSASMFLHQVCHYLSKKSSIDHFSPNSRSAPIDERLLLTDKEFWRTRHGCFAPVRSYVDVPDIENYKLILHLRDPRDVLVSMFYSYCYIHDGPVAANTRYRKETAEQGIDAFVLAKAKEGRSSSYIAGYGTGGPLQDLTGSLVTRYRDYIDKLVGRENVIFVKYEEMVMDFRSWLEKFVEPFPLPDRQGTIDYLISQSPKFFPKRTTDVMVHTRRITPGDHKNKLKKSTIAELDTIFGDILDTLGYDRGK